MIFAPLLNSLSVAVEKRKGGVLQDFYTNTGFLHLLWDGTVCAGVVGRQAKRNWGIGMHLNDISGQREKKTKKSPFWFLVSGLKKQKYV